MKTEQKIKILGKSARYDVCGSCWMDPIPRLEEPQRRDVGPEAFIYRAVVPGEKRCVRLFKVLQTNVCRHNCLYCMNRRDMDHQRSSFAPDELARTFMQLVRARKVDGMFLSSGISDSAEVAQSRMIETASILRNRYQYRGYLHLKVLPGATVEQVKEVVKLADRTSVNLEAPNRKRLKLIAPDKNLTDDIVKPLVDIHRLSQGENVIPAGITTQFVVGPAGESDKEILASTWWLYRNVDLRRAYYSAFSPVPDTPLEGLPATSELREHRLYQADWLLRFYGFDFEELPFGRVGSLPEELDPKHAWALRHIDYFPVEVNEAPKEMLLRTPGIGPVSVERIVRLRRARRFTRLKELSKLGVATKRARDFVLLSGRFYPTPAPAGDSADQLELFAG